MSDTDIVPVFDGHNDTLLRLLRDDDPQARSFFERGERGHVDLPRAREGGFAGGFFAMFTPSDNGGGKRTVNTAGEVSPARPVERDKAQHYVTALAARLNRLETTSDGRFQVVTTADQLAACLDNGTMAAIFHIEGAEAIDPGFDTLELYYRAGLRSLGIVWSRQNIFGHGVPFRFPGTPDIGPGLTGAGEALIEACNRLGILVDLSHLNEKGFWDVARLSQAPLVATHSNAHAICPHPRNLTDDQLRAIRDTDGVVGVNFAVGMLDEEGRDDANLPLETIVRHIEHLLGILGQRGVAIGSDFDGCRVPKAIGSAAGVQELVGAMRLAGFDDALVLDLCHRNWLDLLRRTWR
ncbi:MAG: dipeptidase [Geminicoccaceae bacterium]